MQAVAMPDVNDSTTDANVCNCGCRPPLKNLTGQNAYTITVFA